MLSRKLNITQILNKLAKQRVLLRADFNCPIKEGKITNSKRITSTIPTIKMALEQSPKGVVLMSHLGRPKGAINKKMSLGPVAQELEKQLGTKVTFLNDCSGKDVVDYCKGINNGEVVLLENLRFHIEEEGKGVDAEGNKIKADPKAVSAFRKDLTSLGDVYINDAFGTAHRAHSSMVGVDLPIRAAGLLLKKEIEYFAKALETPVKPFTVILGGAKVSDKIQLIKNLLDKVDEMIIGGGMAFTFLKVVHNLNIGASLYDEEGAKLVPEIMELARAKGVKIHLPLDYLIGNLPPKPTPEVLLGDLTTGVPDGMLGLDIGPKTALINNEVIMRSKTIVWNGPQGYFEDPLFSNGSSNLVTSLMNATTRNGAITIVGGGDSVAMAESMVGASEILSHLSTGGGASLELLEGKELPGILRLSDLE